MSRFSRISKTSIGKKLLMSATGLGMLGFVIGHLLGNLKVFFGPEELNSYAKWLEDHPGVTWPTRIALLLFIGTHIVQGVKLWLGNRAARPTRYVKEATLRASFASRYMLFSGLLMLTFVVFHLAHFTFMLTDPAYKSLQDAAGRHDVYLMVTTAFQNPILAGSYMTAMALLGLHLWHGFASLFQTVGLNHSAYNQPVRNGAKTLVVLLVLGFWSIPVAVLFKLLPVAG